jgi:hypothetical protein
MAVASATVKYGIGDSAKSGKFNVTYRMESNTHPNRCCTAGRKLPSLLYCTREPDQIRRAVQRGFSGCRL